MHNSWSQDPVIPNISDAYHGLCSEAGCLTIALPSYFLFPLETRCESQTVIHQQKDVEISHPVDTDIESNEWMEIFRRNSPFPYCVRKWVNMTDWVKLSQFLYEHFKDIENFPWPVSSQSFESHGIETLSPRRLAVSKLWRILQFILSSFGDFHMVNFPSK